MQQVHARPRLHRSKTDATMGSHSQYRHPHQYAHPRHTEAHIHYPTEETVASGPWQHMAQNYAWVTEQEFVKHEKQTKKTSKWILENQIFVDDLQNDGERKGAIRDTFKYNSDGKGNQRQPTAYQWQTKGERWAEMFYAYEMEADRWMKEQEQARRRAVEMERAKAKVAQEELRRIELARQRQRQREAEKRRIEEERAKYTAARHERELKERAQVDKVMVNAWQAYEDCWKTLSSSSSGPLSFTSIPWPMVSPPSSPSAISSAAIVLFLYSPLHSRSLSRKERIRHAQLRWHPDRFRKVLERVEEQDKQAVEEGVGIVARCLNDLMAREAVASRHQKATM